MAFFGVTSEVLEAVSPHPNADRLEIGKLVGCEFSFILPKGKFKAGDIVLYFPIDSILPQELLVELGLEGMLSGPQKNRIKTKKLRGVISQGIVSDLSVLKGFIPRDSVSITEHLGVTKYEPEAIMEKDANLHPLPAFLSVYDIEGCERYPAVLEYLMGKQVVVSEKLEGMNSSFSLARTGDNHDYFVNQRRFTIKEKDGGEHSFWKMFRDLDMESKLKRIADHLGFHQVTVYGEFVGPKIQDNIYKLAKHEFRVFDIKTDKGFLGFEDFSRVCKDFELTAVPILFIGTLGEFVGRRSLAEVSHGWSVLNPEALREGIVIKPVEEEYSQDLRGRLIIKQRDPVYLAGEKD